MNFKNLIKSITNKDIYFINKEFEFYSFKYHAEESKDVIFFYLKDNHVWCRKEDINKIKANKKYLCESNGNSFTTGLISKDSIVYFKKKNKEGKEISLECFELTVTIH